MVLKQLGMASVSIQAGVEGFLELEPNSNTRFLSGRTVSYTTLSTKMHVFRANTGYLFGIKMGKKNMDLLKYISAK